MALIASGRERPFSLDELFASTTDREGRLRLVSHVFVRVSGYERDDLIGGSYDVIRHPEMPRAVLRAFWKLLHAGRPAAAYVKHLARDGAFYWVMAVAVPVGDEVVSVSLRPASPAFDSVRELYQDVRAVELEDREAGSALLAERLAVFGGYESYMRAALTAEVFARGDRTRSFEPAPVAPELQVVGQTALAAGETLRGIGERLAQHGALSEALKRKSGFVEELAESIRLFALNAILAASRVADNAALGAVAGLLQTRSDAAAPEILALGSELERAATLLSETSFRVGAGRIQAEMVAMLTGESASEPQLRLLAEALAETLERVGASTRALEAALDRLAGVSHAVEEHLKTIRFLELQGRIEAARANDTEHVRVLFEEIGRQVRAAGAELQEFSALGSRENRDDGSTARSAGRIAAALRAAIA